MDFREMRSRGFLGKDEPAGYTNPRSHFFSRAKPGTETSRSKWGQRCGGKRSRKRSSKYPAKTPWRPLSWEEVRIMFSKSLFNLTARMGGSIQDLQGKPRNFPGKALFGQLSVPRHELHAQSPPPPPRRGDEGGPGPGEGV